MNNDSGCRNIHIRGDIMDREQMIELLHEGYTPEYVSLLKWLELRRNIMNGVLINRSDISSVTCAMCKVHYGYKNNCTCCSMSKHFIECNIQSSMWGQINYKINSTKLPVPLHLITQMVNQLQFLVAESGVRNKP